MTKSITINQPVSITSMGFGRDMRAIPRRMEYEGQTYHFAGSGLRTVVKKGEQMFQMLTMNDGSHDFHLRSDGRGGSWTLLSMSL